MLKVEVKFSDEGLQAALASLAGDLAATTELHQALAEGVGETVRGHLLGLNSRSPHTGFYAKASRSVERAWDATAGTVSVPHRGAAQRFYGGSITHKTVKNLAIPTDQVPIRGDERMRPGEFDNLAYLPRKAGAKANVTGYQVEGEKNSNGKLVPKKKEAGGKLMFVLVSEVNQPEDPTVIPDAAALTASAAAAGENYLQASLFEKGLI